MEALVALASLGLAVPGVIDVLVRAGLYLEGKVNQYRRADDTVRDFKSIAHSMARGQIHSLVTIIQMYSRNPNVDDAAVEGLDANFRQLMKDISKAENLLRKLHPSAEEDVNLGLLQKLRLTFLDEIKMKACLDKIRATQIAFTHSSLLCFQIATGPATELLTPDRFIIPHETDGLALWTELPHSIACITRGNFTVGDGSQKTSDVILERRPIVVGGIDDAKVLVRKLQSKPFTEGILPCLGFRRNPYNDGECDLIFTLPTPSERVTLWQDLRRQSKATSLSVRKDICEKLAQAVSYVHSIGIVHKNIRPANILLVSGQTSTALYLTDWTLARSFRSLTSFKSGETKWPEKLYLHPVRQLQSIDERYTILHDIYSLGVCMLEVLLGEPFVLGDSDATYILSPLLKSAFVASRLLPNLTVNDESQKFLENPEHVKTVFVKVAQEELPHRVGDKLASLTVKCLEGFDGHFGEPETSGDYNVSSAQISREIIDGVKYISLVLLELNSISV